MKNLSVSENVALARRTRTRAYLEKLKVCSVKVAANLSLLLKVAHVQHMGRNHLTSLSGVL